MNEYLVITWADSVPVEDGLADAARDRGGQLLAAGPVHDASELDSRPARRRAVDHPCPGPRQLGHPRPGRYRPK